MLGAEQAARGASPAWRRGVNSRALLVEVPRLDSRSAALAGLLVVVALFCAPLLIGLDGWDLGNDEAIYSYAVDRILETGEWLTPRSIQVDGPFLEKPPLKFWMVAAV